MVTLKPPIPLTRSAAIPNSEVLFVQAETQYPATPPALTGFRPVAARRAKAFLEQLIRPQVSCPPEAVMLFRNVFVIDGKQILDTDGRGVAESFADVLLTEDLVARQHRQLARIGRGDIEAVPEAGPPVVAIFKEGSANFGHLLAEMLPRLVHLAAIGVSQIRLLVPHEALPLRAILGFALAALGLSAELIICPADSIVRVPALHWVTPVSQHGFRKSPSFAALMARMCAIAPASNGPLQLCVRRPADAKRPLTNASAVAAIAREAGYLVVEPSELAFPEQLALFAGARQIVGQMGAALTLAAAMPPGGHVTMLDGATCDVFFWDLACLFGHDFNWIFNEELTEYSFDMLHRPLTADLDLLRLALGSAGPAA